MAKQGIHRRSFLTTTVGLTAIASSLAQLQGTRDTAKRLALYVVVRDDPDSSLGMVRELGLDLCEIYCDNFETAMERKIRKATQKYSLSISAVFSMGPGEMVWDFSKGPSTIGLVPRKHREARVQHLIDASEFASRLGIPAVETHCGFIPEDPKEVLYRETVEAIRTVVTHCGKKGQTFLYHSGQETPITQLRIIEDVGLSNQGIGLDTANLIMYGKGHPTQALEVFGKHVKAVNAKDGLYPSDPWKLGVEMPIGKGRVGFPTFFEKLAEIGYEGAVHIEREISGPELIRDLRESKKYLAKLLAEI